MLSRRILAAAGAVLALAAAPAGTLAQSGAGDQQYADPFANTPTPQGSGHAHRAPTHSSTGSGNQTSSPSTTGSSAPSTSASAPATAQSSDPAGTSSTSSSTTTSSGASGTATLPRTGVDSLDEALAGVVLLLAGLGLRMRARRRGARGVLRMR